jgi:hypothetical protein
MTQEVNFNDKMGRLMYVARTIGPRLRTLLMAGVCLLGLLSCTAKSTTSPIVTEFSTIDQTNTGFILQLYQIDSTNQETAFIGLLQKGANGIEWPTALQDYFTALKFSGGSPTPIQYFIKAYSPYTPGTNGDVYYETPVIDQNIVLNGPSTALWYALRTGLSGQPVSLTVTGWQNLLFELDAACPDCLNRSGSASFKMIQQSSSLINGLNAVLATLGNPQVQTSAFQNPPLGIAYSSPPLVAGAATIAAIQGQTENLQVLFFDPTDLSQVVKPDSWVVQYPLNAGSTTIATGTDPSKVSWTFDYNNTGNETITAETNTHNVQTSAVFTFPISYSSEGPQITAPAFQLQANHDKKIDLSAYAFDPRGEAMTFQLLSQIQGLTLNGSILEWMPWQTTPNQLGSNSVTVQVFNTENLSSTATLTLNVAVDNYPQFAPGTPSTWSVTEGVTGTFVFQASDIDGDPLEVTCVSGCGQFLLGSPDPAGWPSLIYSVPTPNPSIYPSAGNFQIPLVTSYLQVIDSPAAVGNSTTTAQQGFPIFLAINYPLATQTILRPLANPPTQNVTVNVLNTADPPVFTVQPLPSPSVLATENIAMTPMPAATAVDPAYNPGSHAVTYSVNYVAASEGSPGGNCKWIQVNASGQLFGTPFYQTAGTCTVTIRASDALPPAAPSPTVLYQDSNPVMISTVDVPRPYNSPAVPIPNATASEGVPFNMSLEPYLNDPDQAVGDPRDNITFTITNGGTPVPGSTGSPGGATIVAGAFTWTPPFSTAPTGGTANINGITIHVTKSGGYSEDLSFNLTVLDEIAPFLVSFLNGSGGGAMTVTNGGGIYNTSINANSNGNAVVQIANQTGDFSQYNYTITESCSPNCSTGMVNISANSGGPTPSPVNLTFNPTYSDGWGGAGASFATHVVTVTVTDAGDSTISTTASLNVAVNTVPQAFTGFNINGDSTNSTYNLSIDGSIYQNNSLTMAALGPDVSNDGIVYTLSAGNIGAISGNLWQWNPLAVGCQIGTQTVVSNFTLQGAARGQTITRNVTATIHNTTTGSGGGCPY